MKKLLWALLLTLPFFVLTPVAADAFSVKTADTYNLASTETVEGNLYIAGGAIKIDGHITGDLVVAGQNLSIDGTVDGDVIAFAQGVNINGEVKGSIRVFGQNINLNGITGRNVNAFGSSINTGSESEIGIDLAVFGAWGSFDGLVKGSLHGGLSQANINSRIGQDVDLDLESSNPKTNLVLGPDAVIGGNLKYTSPVEAEIANPEAISGTVEYQQPSPKTTNWTEVLMKKFYQLAGLILIGLVLLGIRKKSFATVSEVMKKKPWASLLIGLAVLVATPVVMLILIITAIGIPLALLLLAGYLILLGISVIYSAYYLGVLVVDGLNKKPINPFVALIIGLFILVILSIVPLLGGLLIFLFILFGLGALSINIKNDYLC